MKKYFAEFIGTFALVFCGTGAIVIDQQTKGSVSNTGIAITFGLIVLSMIYALGNISGAHINPAVTIAFTAAKRFPFKEVPQYILAQVSGAIIASSVLKILFPENILLGTTLPAGPVSQSFIMEFILSFILMLVIITVSYGSKEQGTLAGIAIGSVVLLEAMFAGPISGASMNPARSIAPAIISGNIQHLWIYIVGPISGTCTSIVVWNILKPDEL
jgi:aquaporin Z